MAEGELPPVIARFISDISDFITPITEAIEQVKDFQEELNRAAASARDFSAQVAQTGATTAAAMRVAADAIDRAAVAQEDLTAAMAATATMADDQARANAEAAASAELDAMAVRSQRDATLEAAAAQREQNQAQNAAAPKVNDVTAALRKFAAAQQEVAESGEAADAATSFWKKKFQLSGGLFGMMPILGEVSGIELVIHGAIEFLAVFIPAIATATIGLTAWGLAAYKSGKEVFMAMYNADTLTKALNEHVGPLKGSFQELSDAVRPQVFELFGEYLDMSAHSSGALADLVMRVGTALDHMFATLEVNTAKGGSGLKDFFDSGIADFHLFGTILKNIGAGLGAFAEAAMKTHIAEILLGIAAAASQVVALIAKIPAPALTAFVAIHGGALWGGLALTRLKNIALSTAGAFGKLSALNGPMTAFSRAIGASADQLAALGEVAPGVSSIADDIAAGVPGAYELADALELSGKSIVKVVSQTETVERAAKALNVSAADVAQFATAMNKSGISIDDLAARAAGGTDRVAELTSGMEKGTSDAANLAMAYTMTGKGAASAAEAAASIGEDAGEAAASTGLFGTALSGLEAALPGGPIAWLVALGVAVAGVGVYLGMQPDSTQKWINTLNKSVQSASNLNMLGTTVSALADDTKQLSNAQATATGNATELAKTQQGLSGDLQNELMHVGQLQKAYGVSMPQALAMLQTAGVKSTDLMSSNSKAWAVDLEMVHGLTAGYAAMGQSLGAVGSDMNALSVSQSSQLSSMATLNSAFDAFTGYIAAPSNDVLSLASDLGTFATDAKAAGASMNGLGANSVTLQQQFQSMYADVEQSFDAFRNANALSGTSGTTGFTSFVKDAVASLLPLAKNSKMALAEVSTLAQEAGGPASTNLKTLSEWAGKVNNPLTAMYNTANKAAIAASNLNQDAAQLSNTLQSDLNPNIASATMTALGGQQSLTAFADALLKTGANSPQTLSAGKGVAEMFLSIDKNSSSAEAQFVGWTESLGMTSKASTQLWDQVSKGVKPLTAVRDQLASTNEATENLGKRGGWGNIEHFFMSLYNKLGGWKAMLTGALTGGGIGGMILGRPILAGIEKMLPLIVGVATKIGKAVATAFKTYVKVIKDVWDTVSRDVASVLNKLKATIMADFEPWWKKHGQEVMTVARVTWTAVRAIIMTAWIAIASVVMVGMRVLETFWALTWGIFGGVLKGVWDAIVIVVETAWNVVINIIKYGLKVILDVIGVMADLMTGHWHAAWSDMVNAATAALDGIGHVILAIGSGLVKLLYTVGKDLILGLIHGMEDMTGVLSGSVAGIGHGILNVAEHILGVASPSTEFAYLGQMITLGLASGINDTKSQATSEASALAAAIVNAAAAGLISSSQEVSLKATLASTLKSELSTYMIGLLGTASQVSAMMTTIAKMVTGAESAGQLSTTQGSALSSWLSSDNTRLQALANQRAKIISTINTAKAYATTTATAAAAGADFSAVISGSSSGSTPTVAGIITSLQANLNTVKKFRANIAKLKKMGLDRAYLGELIAAGPVQGGPIAAELAATSEGNIHTINTLSSYIHTASVDLGQTAANAMYDSGAQAGKGFLSGLEAQQAAITAVMKNIATAVVNTIKKELGIASPSRVLMQHGYLAAEGLALGIEQGTSRVRQAAQAMSQAVTAGATHSSIIATSSSGQMVINLRTEVTGKLDNKTLWTAMQQETFRYNIRNSGQVTGAVKPGSA